MIDPETLRDEWGTVWVSNGTKTHIMPTCPYVTDDHHEKDVSKYPASHMDLCSWCEERFRRWRNGVDTDIDLRCHRCGCETEQKYCADCFETVQKRRARQ